MLQGNFVFDCVVHAYNMSDANLLDRPDAEIGRGSILRLGQETRAPGSDLGYTTFARDWTHQDLWDMVFARSNTDRAMAQTVPIFAWITDGFPSATRTWKISAPTICRRRPGTFPT